MNKEEMMMNKKQSSLEMIGIDNNYKNEIKVSDLYRNFYLKE